jgi:tetratricopeptide (TPR) repeat protein
MKRPKGTHVLEDESKLALRNILPPEWIYRARDNPDYGIDSEIEIVESEEVTNYVLWVQLKATNKRFPDNKVTYQISTDHLIYYESCRLPIVILYYLKPQNRFYYLFAQRYIRDILSKQDPAWRKKKTTTLYFSQVLTEPKTLKSIATDGYLELYPEELRRKFGEMSPIYFVDGIPNSDDEVLKSRIAKGLSYINNEQYKKAITEFKNILEVCTLAPAQRIAVYINLGNASHTTGNNQEAIKYYQLILDLKDKVNEQEQNEIEAIALGNLGLVYSVQGNLNKAEQYQQESLKLHRELGYKQGKANAFGNLGLVYFDQGNLKKAEQYLKEALKLHRELGYKQGKANAFGNLGIIYRVQKKRKKAEQYLKEALKLHRELGNKQGEANQLVNLGITYCVQGNLKKAELIIQDAIKLHRELGYKQGEANALCNLGPVYRAQGNLKKAKQYYQEALKLHRELGDKQGEATDLGNLGLVYRDQGNLKKAMNYLQQAVIILNECNIAENKAIFEKAIKGIKKQLRKK